MESNKSKIYQRHCEESVLINARPEDVFAYADNQFNLSSHMKQSSWMMGGGRMDISVDEGRGQKVGSHIKMNGRVLGISLFLDEVVTRREPPRVKEWETTGDIKLLVIGHYRMRFEIEPQNGNLSFRVSIDYNLPATNVWLGRLFGGFYAKWCVNQMIKSASDHFSK